MLVLGILVNIIISLSTVFANDDLHYVFKFEVENTNKYEIARDDNLDLIVSIKGTEDVIYLDVIAGGANITREVDILCNQEKSACTVTVPKERGEVSFRYNDLDITTGTTLINPDMKFSFGKDFSIKEPLENNPGTGNDYHFDGRAVVVWSCESGICYHKFDVVDPEHCDMENPTEADDSCRDVKIMKIVFICMLHKMGKYGLINYNQ